MQYSEEPNSFDLHWGGVQIACKSLFEYYGVEIRQTRRYHDPTVLDGILIVDL